MKASLSGHGTRFVREANLGDSEAIWSILEPVIRAGETNSLPRDMTREDALAHWFGSGHEVFVATQGNKVLSTYYLFSL